MKWQVRQHCASLLNLDLPMIRFGYMLSMGSVPTHEVPDKSVGWARKGTISSHRTIRILERAVLWVLCSSLLYSVQ